MIRKKGTSINGKITPQHQEVVGRITNQEAQMNGRVRETSIINYNNLYNKPTIEGVVLEGDKTFEDLNLVPLSNADLARILD